MLYKKILIKLLGRQRLFRLSRALYIYSRGDFPNNMENNGEMFVQNLVIKAWLKNHLISPNRIVVFDVGSNIGDWSLSFIKLFSDNKQYLDLYCFEPVPGTNATLKKNLLNIFNNVHIENIGLSSVMNEAQIYVSNESNCGTNSLHNDNLMLSRTALPINLITASQYCNEKSVHHIHLFKCDTEGHDFDVITGALPLLQESRISVLQFEYNHRWVISRYFLRDVFNLIENLPYKLAKIQPNSVMIFNEWHHELDKFFEANYLLIHKSALSWFPTKYAKFSSSNTF
jgi:FkbM family methyltransferase